MITAHSALSIRRRGSSNSGKNDPARSFGIPTRSPAGVDNNVVSSASISSPLVERRLDQTVAFPPETKGVEERL
jgi:hypothetical protein